MLCTGFILMCVLLGLTVNQPVAQDEIGIAYNNYTKDLGAPKTQGVYTLSVGERFILFKRTLQDVGRTSIACLTADGLRVHLTVSAQFQYTPEGLVPTVLLLFGSDGAYQDFVDNVFENVILRVCGAYVTQQYYEERGAVYGAMYNAVLSEFNTTAYAVTFAFFQLVNIAFPSEYQAVITRKQVLQQTRVTAINARTTQLIDAETGLLQKNFSAHVALNNASRAAAVIANQGAASAEVVATLWRRRAETLAGLVRELALNTTQLLAYLDGELVRQSQGAVLAV